MSKINEIFLIYFLFANIGLHKRATFIINSFRKLLLYLLKLCLASEVYVSQFNSIDSVYLNIRRGMFIPVATLIQDTRVGELS